MPQMWVGIAFVLGALALGGAFLLVAASARTGPVSYEDVTRAGSRVRRAWFGVLLVAAVVALALTLPRMPYEALRVAELAADEEPVPVTLEAEQFTWHMDPQTLPAERPLAFEVTSVDVNHGFGIYGPDDDTRLVGQVQAMPGYTNNLVMAFDEPGTYWIRCLELCGLGHHAMILQFDVVDEGAEA